MVEIAFDSLVGNSGVLYALEGVGQTVRIDRRAYGRRYYLHQFAEVGVVAEVVTVDYIPEINRVE